MDSLTRRILAQLGDLQLIEKIEKLNNNDFNSLLLSLFNERSKTASAPAILKAFDNNRLTSQSNKDPIALHSLEIELLQRAHRHNIESVILSPAAPINSCSVFGYVSQNNIISAARSSEILADPTNMLALILASRIKDGSLQNNEAAHICATTRVIRAQHFPKSEEYTAHFGLYCMVSSTKSRQGFDAEIEMMHKHLDYYLAILTSQQRANTTLILNKRAHGSPNFFDSVVASIQKTYAELTVVTRDFDVNNGYYKGLNFKLYITHDSEELELADGGYVEWIQSLTSNNKERCFISGLGIERLLMI